MPRLLQIRVHAMLLALIIYLAALAFFGEAGVIISWLTGWLLR